MNQYKTERSLCSLYALIAVSLGVSIICLAVPYTHWQATLDACPGSRLENTNCGCILFGISANQHFNGGHNSNCLYAILGPLPILVYAIVMALFHMYRVCINNVGQYEDKSTTALDQIEGESIVVSSRVQVTQNTDGVIYCWVPSACIASIFCIYNLAHAIFVTVGFLKTCSQYRINLVRELNVSGDQAAAIHFRLDCQSIYDFMDYLLKDAPNSRRGEFINTGIALHMALLMSWLAVVLWLAITVLTAKRAYAERGVLTCCGN